MIHEYFFVICMSEMLGNPPFHRGAKRMRMKENGEKKMEKLFVDFMINCPAICSLAQRQVIGSPSLWPPPHTYATSAYDSLERLWRWKGAPPKHFSGAVPTHFSPYIKVLLPH